MNCQNIYITANELAEVMGVSNGHAYKLIREMNSQLRKADCCNMILPSLSEVYINICK